MQFYTVKEAAKHLGLSPSLVYSLCGRKRLRHERHGLGRGKILIPEDALAEYRRRVTVEVERGAAPPPPGPEKATAGRFEVLDAARLREAWNGSACRPLRRACVKRLRLPLRHRPEVGAGCGSAARPDLSGGPSARAVPTGTGTSARSARIRSKDNEGPTPDPLLPLALTCRWWSPAENKVGCWGRARGGLRRAAFGLARRRGLNLALPLSHAPRPSSHCPNCWPNHATASSKSSWLGIV
jgi:excisionase family DNA binding protein